MIGNRRHTRNDGGAPGWCAWGCGVAVLLLLCPTAFAHGVHAHAIHGGLGLAVEYDGGYPMAYAEVRVYAPDDDTRPYTEGFTDAEGYFVFFPAREGPWRMIVDDGMGHRIETNIAPDSAHHSFVFLPPRRVRWQEAVFGLVLIFALFGGYAAWLSASQKRKRI